LTPAVPGIAFCPLPAFWRRPCVPSRRRSGWTRCRCWSTALRQFALLLGCFVSTCTTGHITVMDVVSARLKW